MAKYTHVCEDCETEVEVRCHMDQRDDPKTARKVTNGEKLGQNEVTPHKTSEGVECLGTLVRSENLDVTAFTPYSWRP